MRKKKRDRGRIRKSKSKGSFFFLLLLLKFKLLDVLHTTHYYCKQQQKKHLSSFSTPTHTLASSLSHTQSLSFSLSRLTQTQEVEKKMDISHASRQKCILLFPKCCCFFSHYICHEIYPTSQYSHLVCVVCKRRGK